MLYFLYMYELRILLPLFVFCFGLLIGSFLNVVIYRLNTGRSLAKGRSACMTCARTLSWYELVPVFSFLAQKGKCRKCQSEISFQYPFVELATGILFVVIYMKMLLPFSFSFISIATFLGGLYIASLLVVIAVYDIRHKIIPDVIVYQLIAFGIFAILFRDFTNPAYSVITGVFEGALVALPFFLIWFFTKGRGMGFGDVKLALGMGLLLGLSSGFAMFFISFWLGALIGLFLLALSRAYGMKSEIPFAPFMIAAFFITTLWQVNLSSLFSFLP